jgi:dolichol-phosphate mannosyltransferase
MQAVRAPYVLCLDSDGQCDPRDFAAFWEARRTADAVTGWRVHRADTWLRRNCSRLFYGIYQGMFHVPVHDPSCPFVLARAEVVRALMGEMGEMEQGFWWEFVARVHRRGFSIREMPVNHRSRAGGTTQVYRYRKMPKIFFRHCLALFRIRSQTRRACPPPVRERIEPRGPA